MSAQTSTTTQQFATLNLRGRDQTPPRSLTEGLQVAPLEFSGALTAEKYPRTQLTPAIGVEFAEGVKLKEILALPQAERDATLKDLALLISENGVVFFKDQNELSREDIAELGLALGTLAGKPKESTLHIHPTQELGENGLPVGKISNVAEKDGRQISFADEHSSFASHGWHSDVSFEPFPSMYTILKMHTIPETGGDTLWQAGYSTYDALSPHMRTFLEGLTATHDAHRFREQSRRNGYTLRTAPRGHPENSGDAFRAVHPVIRTNPSTGRKSVYVNITFTTRINELSFDESRSVLDYLFKLQHESHDHHVKYKWSPHNTAIWDNRCVHHLATFDYTEYRGGDRVVVCGEAPYLDPKSYSRKEYQAALKASQETKA